MDDDRKFYREGHEGDAEPIPILTISSGKGGVGKTVIAANLARLLSWSGQSILLVDLDLYNRGASALLADLVTKDHATVADLLTYAKAGRLSELPGAIEKMNLIRCGEASTPLFLLPSTRYNQQVLGAEYHYDVPELWVYVADEFGLLNPDQVERIALHEIGHALGMRSHSPIPNDLMFQRVVEGPGPARLSVEDINSFVSLYMLPNGTVYRRLGQGPPPARPGPPAGAPVLALAPHVDARRGFEMQLPLGWLKVDTPTGFAAVDGTTWDWAASLQLIVRRFPTIDAYLARHTAAHVRDGTVLAQGETTVAGHRAFLLVVQSADGVLVDRVTLIETGDGRVLVAIAACTPDECEAYEPWFEASLATLEVRGSERGGARRRDYRPGP